MHTDNIFLHLVAKISHCVLVTRRVLIVSIVSMERGKGEFACATVQDFTMKNIVHSSNLIKILSKHQINYTLGYLTENSYHYLCIMVVWYGICRRIKY